MKYLILFIVQLFAAMTFAGVNRCKICNTYVNVIQLKNGSYVCKKHYCEKHKCSFKVECNKCIKDKENDAKAKTNAEYKQISEARTNPSELAQLLLANAAKRKKDAEEAAKRKQAEELAEYKKQAEEVQYLLICKEYYENIRKWYETGKNCPIHKWSQRFAPRYGGDFYTNQSKAIYAQNMMLAMNNSKLECNCLNESRKDFRAKFSAAARILGKMQKPYCMYYVNTTEIYNRLITILKSKDDMKIIIQDNAYQDLLYLKSIIPTEKYLDQIINELIEEN